MSSTGKEKILELEKIIFDTSKHLDLMRSIIEKFPDLKVDTNRWKKERYNTELVNSIVDKVEIYHACGCCPDSILRVSPYIEIEGINIYSEPPTFGVGEKSYSGGDNFDNNWEQQLQNKNINSLVIDIIKEYQDKNRPTLDDDSNDDYDI